MSEPFQIAKDIIESDPYARGALRNLEIAVMHHIAQVLNDSKSTEANKDETIDRVVKLLELLK